MCISAHVYTSDSDVFAKCHWETAFCVAYVYLLFSAIKGLKCMYTMQAMNLYVSTVFASGYNTDNTFTDINKISLQKSLSELGDNLSLEDLLILMHSASRLIWNI